MVYMVVTPLIERRPCFTNVKGIFSSDTRRSEHCVRNQIMIQSSSLIGVIQGACFFFKWKQKDTQSLESNC